MYLRVSITSLIKDKILPATWRKTNKWKDSSMFLSIIVLVTLKDKTPSRNTEDIVKWKQIVMKNTEIEIEIT